MFGGINKRQVEQMMRKMGMSQEDLDVSSVVVHLGSGGKMVFESPSFQKIVMRGEEQFQLVGDYTLLEEGSKVSIRDDDIGAVVEQTRVSEEQARKALEQSQGDIAKAIISLQS